MSKVLFPRILSKEIQKSGVWFRFWIWNSNLDWNLLDIKSKAMSVFSVWKKLLSFQFLLKLFRITNTMWIIYWICTSHLFLLCWFVEVKSNNLQDNMLGRWVDHRWKWNSAGWLGLRALKTFFFFLSYMKTKK